MSRYTVTVRDVALRDGSPPLGQSVSITVTLESMPSPVFEGTIGDADNLREALARGIARARRIEDL